MSPTHKSAVSKVARAAVHKPQAKSAATAHARAAKAKAKGVKAKAHASSGASHSASKRGTVPISRSRTSSARPPGKAAPSSHKPASSRRIPGPGDKILRGVEWRGGLEDGVLVLLDQTKLPIATEYLAITEVEGLRSAIIDLVVRGAPAIGIAAAYGLVLHLYPHARRTSVRADEAAFAAAFALAHQRLLTSRPTAVNLQWALDRMRDCFDRHSSHLTALEMCARLLMEAKRIHREDAELCARIADNGAHLLPEMGGVLTHCNTGALATGGVGTALGCIVHAVRAGKKISVFAGETRPLLQGARLTAMELLAAGVPVTLITDSMAAHLMQRGLIQAVIVGADRITANGDVANKIGTYSLAVLAHHHHIPFYVAAPYSTFDLSLDSGEAIVIEERKADEVRRPQGTLFAPSEVPVANPAFDVTPAALISALITERGVIKEPTRASVAQLMADRQSEPAV